MKAIKMFTPLLAMIITTLTLSSGDIMITNYQWWIVVVIVWISSTVAVFK